MKENERHTMRQLLCFSKVPLVTNDTITRTNSSTILCHGFHLVCIKTKLNDSMITKQLKKYL